MDRAATNEIGTVFAIDEGFRGGRVEGRARRKTAQRPGRRRAREPELYFFTCEACGREKHWDERVLIARKDAPDLAICVTCIDSWPR